MKKKICTNCKDSKEVIRVLDVRDIEKLHEEISNFQHIEDASCDITKININIRADGSIFLSGNFEFYHEQEV